MRFVLPQRQAESMLDAALRSGRICRVKWYTKDGEYQDRLIRLWAKKAITYHPIVLDNPCAHIPYLYTCLDIEKAARLGDTKGWVNVDCRNVVEVKQKGLLALLFGF